jgi:hypothetical protein
MLVCKGWGGLGYATGGGDECETEKEECIDIKHEDGIYIEKEKEIDTKEEVSWEDTV